jgi:hypothetical protein
MFAMILREVSPDAWTRERVLSLRARPMSWIPPCSRKNSSAFASRKGTARELLSLAMLRDRASSIEDMDLK